MKEMSDFEMNSNLSVHFRSQNILKCFLGGFFYCQTTLFKSQGHSEWVIVWRMGWICQHRKGRLDFYGVSFSFQGQLSKKNKQTKKHDLKENFIHSLWPDMYDDVLMETSWPVIGGDWQHSTFWNEKYLSITKRVINQVWGPQSRFGNIMFWHCVVIAPFTLWGYFFLWHQILSLALREHHINQILIL